MLAAFSFAQSLPAQPIVNPLYEETDWKNWYLDPEPLVNSNTSAVLAMPEPEHRTFPADVPDSETNPDLFLHHLGEDYPGRTYAGVHGDVFISYDGFHSSFKPTWSDDLGNFVDLKPNDGFALQRLGSTQIVGFGDNFHAGKRFVGQIYSTFSIFGGGAPGWTTIKGQPDFERDHVYANNAWTAQGTATGYSLKPKTKEEATRYVPLAYMSRGHSGSASMMTTKLIVTGGYLHRDLKPEIIRQGLMGPTMQYLMRSTLPYDVPWESELRHAAGMWSDGYNSYQGGHSLLGYRTLETIDNFSNEYDRHAHLRNMVTAAKELTVIPPLVEIDLVELLSGEHAYGDEERTLENSGSASKSSHGYLQPFGSTFQARIKAVPLDPNGLPVELRWALVIGDKRASVVDEGDDVYLVTIPHDPDLPAGRTTLIVWADNGVTTGLPSAINVLRSDVAFPADNEPERDWAGRLPLPDGYERESKWVPGETVLFDLHAPAPSGYPVTWIKWDGVGEMDGNRFRWEIPVDEPVGEHYAVMIGSDRTNGLGQHGAKALLRVRDVAARPGPRFSIGFGPQSVDFDASASAAKDGLPLTYEWDFDADGSPDASGATASHTFATPGIHEVVLTASSASLATSDTTSVFVEVRPDDWTAELWEDGASAPDPAVWNVAGGSITSSGGKWLFEETEAGDGSSQIARLETAAAPERPFALEIVYEDGSSSDRAYLSVCGLAVGALRDHIGENYEIGRETAPGVVDDIQPLSGDLPEEGPFRLTRVYVRDDPNHSGKVIVSGLVRNAFGDFPFYRDNWEPGDGLVALTARRSLRTRLEVDALRLWQPDGEFPDPVLYLTDADARTLMESGGWNLGSSHFDRLVSDQSDFGSRPVGQPVERSFTLRNFGGSDLELTSSAPDYLQILDADGFTLVDSVDGPVIQAGGEDTIRLRFDPTGGWQGALYRFNSNVGSPRFVFTGHSAEGERNIAVEGRNVLIASGDSSPDPFDGTDFGKAANGETVMGVFLIRNTGQETLNLSAASLAGATDFSILRQPRTPLGRDESSELRLAFHPASAGEKTATVTIPSDDPDTPAFTFDIRGNGLGAIAPEIAVSGNPDFGDVPWTDAPTAPATRSFTIENTGDAPLRLTGPFPHVTFSGPDAGAFAVYRAAPGLIHPGDSAELILLFHPQKAGGHSATLTLHSNDADEPQTQIPLTANGISAPAIEVRDSRGVLIENGDAWPRRDDGTAFGTLTSSGSIDRSFHIHNPGSAALMISSTQLSGVGAGEFSILSAPASVPAGGSAALTLRFNPASAGSHRATLAIHSNDPRTPTWTFDVSGGFSALRSRGDRGVDRGLWAEKSQRGIAWGDFDNDGDLDLLLTGSTLVDSSAADYNDQLWGRTTLYANDGSGNFSAVPVNLPHLRYSDAAWGDYDGDGDLDLVISGAKRNTSTSQYDNQTDIYRNDGGDFFPISAGLPALRDAEMVWVDFDNDGDLDLFLVGNTAGDNQAIVPLIRLYRNDGGTFSDSGMTFPAALYNARSVWTDVNGDGFPDALLIGHYGSGFRRLDVGLSDGAGGFSWTLLEDEITAHSADWADIDRDGRLDVVSMHRIDSSPRLVVYRQNADATFTRYQPQGDGQLSITQLTAGDLDTDGYADLALHVSVGVNDQDLHVAFNEGVPGGTIAQSSGLTNAAGTELSIGDFSGDGVNDLFSTGRGRDTSKTAFYFGEGAVNAPPAVPDSLEIDLSDDGGLVMNWSASTDPDFPGSEAIRYDLRIGTAPGLDDIKPVIGDANGYRRIPQLGAIGGTSYTFTRALPPGTYHVAVQAVDPGFAGSSWIEVEILIEAELDVVDDVLTVPDGSSSVLDVLANDGVPFLSEITEVTQPLHGSVSIAAGGQSLRYDSEGYWGQHGALTFSYTLADFDESGGVQGEPQSAMVTLSVEGVRTASDDLAGRTLVGIGLGADDFAARTRIDGDKHLQAIASGTLGSTVDKAVFAYRELTGDFTETLRVRTLIGDASARSGLMARSTEAADAPFAQVSTGTGDHFHGNHRALAGAVSSPETTVTPTPPPDFPDRWVRLIRSGDTLVLAYATDGENFSQLESLDISGWNAPSLLVGEFLHSGDDTRSANALLGEITFTALDDSADTVEGQAVTIDVLANDSTNGGAQITAVTQPVFGSVTIQGDHTLRYHPSGYYGWDGPVSFTYTAEEDGASSTATVTIQVAETEPHNNLPGFDFDGFSTLGSGASDGRLVTATGNLEISNRGGAGLSQSAASDGLTFLHQEILGDFKAIVRLRSLGGSAARAGLMLREGDGNRVRTVWIGADALGQIHRQTRGTDGAAADAEEPSALPAMTFPDVWLRIERWRDTVRLFASADGLAYSQIGQTVTLPDLAGQVRIGLFTFGGSGSGATADFSDYSLEIETGPGIANGGIIDNGRTHDLTSLGTDDWVVWGQFGTGAPIRKSGGSGRIGDLTIGAGSTSEPLDSEERSYNKLTWSDGDPIASASGQWHGTIVRGPVNDPASVDIAVGRGQGTVHVIFSVANYESHNMRGEATVLSSEPGVEPLTIAPLQTNDEGYNVRFDYVSAREDTVFTVRMAKILDDSSGARGVFIPQALALSRTEIPGGDGGPPFFLPVNTSAPEAVDDAYTIVGGSAWSLDVTANDTDPDLWQGTPSLQAIATQPTNGSASIHDGKVSYSPHPGFHGNDSFTYTVTDGAHSSAPATVAVTVLDPADPTDSDSDGLPDVFEIAAYGDLSRDGSDDFDEDGVIDGLEFALGRNAAGIDRVTLDFLDDFERGPGSLTDHPGMWHFDPDGTTGAIQNAMGAEGSSGLELVTADGESADLTLHLPDHWQAASWKQFEAILATYADDADAPEIDPEAAVAFYLIESGDIHIRDGADWYALGLSLDTAARHRYTVRQDYLAQTWQLWVNGTLVTDPPAAFANAVAVPSFFRISQGAEQTAVFDNLAVTAGVPAGSLGGLLDYSSWRDALTWNGADNTPGGDPNNNSLPNLLEYGFGYSDPADGSHRYSTPLELDPDSGEVSFTFRRNRAAEDLSFTVETSPDLSPGSWTPVRPAVADVTVTPTGDSDVDEITIRLTAPETRLFVRLRVE